MTASIEFLSTLVSIALAATLISPALLIVLLIRDWKRGQQW